MKKLKWYQYFAVGAYVAGWIARALPDKKITKAEMYELMEGILAILEVDEIEFE